MSALALWEDELSFSLRWLLRRGSAQGSLVQRELAKIFDF